MKKAVICDIDGVGCDYMESLRRYASKILGRELPTPDRSFYNAAESLGLTKKEAWRIQGMHYMSGALARAPLYDPWVVPFLQALDQIGVHIIMLTNRPDHKYPNLEFDTHEWLMHYRIPYDRLTFTRDKGEYVEKLSDELTILYAIEDMPENCLKLAERHVLTFMPDRPYNRGAPKHDLIKRIHGPMDITGHLRALCIEY